MKQIHSPHLDYIRRKALQKKIVMASKKISYCRHCGFQNGKSPSSASALYRSTITVALQASSRKQSDRC